MNIPPLIWFNFLEPKVRQYLLTTGEINQEESQNLTFVPSDKFTYVSGHTDKVAVKIQYRAGKFFTLSLCIGRVEGQGTGHKIAICTTQDNQRIYINYGIVHKN